jgi:DNA-binding CsgD family transcriptional regulator
MPSPQPARRDIGSQRKTSGPGAAPAAGFDLRASAVFKELSPRQMEVLALLVDGRTDHEIGVALGISPRTARAHVEKVRDKLHVQHRRKISGRVLAILWESGQHS